MVDKSKVNVKAIIINQHIRRSIIGQRRSGIYQKIDYFDDIPPKIDGLNLEIENLRTVNIKIIIDNSSIIFPRIFI